MSNGGKLSDFSESTAMALIPEKPSKGSTGGSVAGAISGGVKGVVEAAKGAAKSLANEGTATRSKLMGKTEPESLTLWMMEYLKSEQKTMNERTAASLEFLNVTLDQMREATKGQKALNDLTEETMNLLIQAVNADQKRARAKSWWEWVRDVTMIGLSAGVFFRLGHVTANQRLMIGEQVRPPRELPLQPNVYRMNRNRH